VDLLRHHRRLTSSGRAAGLGLLLPLLGACAPTVVEIEPAQPIGPTLVIDVANGSNEERSIGYQFEMGQSSGGGEGTVLGCERATISFGEIGGRYSILVDGEAVTQGALPANIPGERTVLVRVRIAEDGTATAAAPALLARAPQFLIEPIPGCG
jgi:hypothetical protein